MKHLALPQPGRRLARPARGLSLVEMLVGITIGLFIVAGATMVATTQLSDNRRLMLETQLNQDMRATLDMMSRDLRQAGYWAKAWWYARPTDQARALANPYAAIQTTATRVEYARSENEIMRGKLGVESSEEAPEDVEAAFAGTIDGIEAVGFRLNQTGDTVQMKLTDGEGLPSWQALTDVGVMKVTGLSIAMRQEALSLPCAHRCPLNAAGLPLQLVQRHALIGLDVQAQHDANVRRSADVVVKLRNDVLK